MKSILKPIYFFVRSLLLHALPGPKATSIAHEQVNRILIIRLDRIGDLVLSTGFFRALDKCFPRAAITALVRSRNADIVRNNPHIDEVIEYPGFTGTLKTLGGRYDLVFDPLMDYTIRTAVLTRMLKPRFSVGFDINSRGRLFTSPVPLPEVKEHFVDSLFRLLAPFGIEPAEDRRPEIFLSDTVMRETERWRAEHGAEGAFCIAVHPGGFYPSQHWPERNFAELLAALSAKHAQAVFFIIGDASERASVNRIANSAGARMAPVIGQPLMRSIALIGMSRLFIGNHSGLLHIAAALKVPTLSTMGPNIPWIWHPYGDTASNVMLRKEVGCNPCNRGACEDHRCLTSISVEEMMAAAETLLKEA